MVVFNKFYLVLRPTILRKYVMTTIAIFDLPTSGLDLFSDSESYMTELNDKDLIDINGGIGPIGASLVVTAISAYVALNGFIYGGQNGLNNRRF
jgi:lactobin A/cerein 7B family class IIb bacteriocin